MFVDEINAKLFDLIRSMREDGAASIEVTDVFDRLEDEKERQRLSEIAMIEFDPDEIEIRYRERLNTLGLPAVKKRLQELKELIAEAEAKADTERLNELTRERQKLAKFIPEYTQEEKGRNDGLNCQARGRPDALK